MPHVDYVVPSSINREPEMNKLLLALVAACFAVMLAMPVSTEAKARQAGLNAGAGVELATEFSSRRHWRGRYWRGRHWGYRRAYWGPRRMYWGPRYRYWGPRYWGPRRVWWGPRYRYWGPRYYWRPRPVFFGPRVYWGPRRYWW
jgi:hypothetical protein